MSRHTFKKPMYVIVRDTSGIGLSYTEIPDNLYRAPSFTFDWADWSNDPAIVGLSIHVGWQACVTRRGNRFAVNLLAHLAIVATVTRSFRAANFSVATFFCERQTRGRSSPSFRRIVAAVYQSPDRSVASGQQRPSHFVFDSFSHDAHFAHFCIAIERMFAVTCAIDRSERS